MMNYFGFSSIVALAIGSIARGGFTMPPVTMVSTPGQKGSGKAFDWRYGGGRTYPHSSDRQRARYARQIAAGQLSMDGLKAREA